MIDECLHRWHCPGPVTGQGPAGPFILLPLYCTRCAATITRQAPAPEMDEKARARAQIAVPQLVPTPKR